MNDPASNNFMSPTSRGPPNKKVRGGSTPRLSGVDGGGGGGPPPAQQGPPPPPPTVTAAIAATGATGTTTTLSLSDSSARRKAEMRRLAEARSRSRMLTRDEPPVAAAGPEAGPLAAGGPAAAGGPPPPPPPMRPAGAARHHSDLFPSVSKQPSPGGPSPPPPPAVDVALAVPTPSEAPPTVRVPPRKLEYPSAVAGSVKSRSKSAPPRRPPPQGPPPIPPTHNPVTGQTLKSTTPSKNIPFSRTQERARLAQEAKKGHLKGPAGSPEKAKSPHLVPSSKNVHEGVIPRKTQPQQEQQQQQQLKPPVNFASPPPSNTTTTTTTTTTMTGGEANPKKIYPKTPPPPSSSLSSSSLSSSLLPLTTPGHLPGDETPPSTGPSSRREKMRLMREGAEEPPTPSPTVSPKATTKTTDKSTNSFAAEAVAQQRLEVAYEKEQAAKVQALKQVKELEDRLNQVLTETSPPPPPLVMERLLQLADHEGPEAAVKFVRENVNRDNSAGSLLSLPPPLPSSPLRGIFARKKVTDRTLAPRALDEADQQAAIQQERDFIGQYRQAVDCVPFEYKSETATFVIRRPYGSDAAQRLFSSVSLLSPPDYAQRAHVSEDRAIEVAAIVHADNSLMLLFDQAGVRYKTNPNASEWTTIANVDDDDVDAMPHILPTITYIDDQAVDQQYSLETVLEEALLVREQYCRAVTATAKGFVKNPPGTAGVPTASNDNSGNNAPSPSLAKAPSKDAATETDEQGPMGGTTVQVDDNAAAGTSSPPHVDIQKKAEADASSSGSADVLIVFVGLIFSGLFGLLYFLLIGLPLRGIRTALIFSVAYFILSAAYLYAAQGYQDHLMSMSILTTEDLLFYSNRHPGIM